MGNSEVRPLSQKQFLITYTGTDHFSNVLLCNDDIKQIYKKQIKQGKAIIKEMKDHEFEGNNWIPYDDKLQQTLTILLGPKPRKYLKRFGRHSLFFTDFIRTFVPERISYIKTYDLPT